MAGEDHYCNHYLSSDPWHSSNCIFVHILFCSITHYNITAIWGMPLLDTCILIICNDIAHQDVTCTVHDIARNRIYYIYFVMIIWQIAGQSYVSYTICYAQLTYWCTVIYISLLYYICYAQLTYCYTVIYVIVILYMVCSIDILSCQLIYVIVILHIEVLQITGVCWWYKCNGSFRLINLSTCIILNLSVSDMECWLTQQVLPLIHLLKEEFQY